MTASRWPTLVFITGALAVLTALGWVTFHTLRLERREQEARADAGFQESIRLVLWRMDAAITPVIAREAARPYFEYQPFYPANRAYTRMLSEVQAGEVLVPSPLLQPADPFLKLHFQQTEQELTSPQVPMGEMRTLAESTYTTGYALATAEQNLEHLHSLLAQDLLKDGWRGFDEETVVGRGEQAATSEADHQLPPQQFEYQQQTVQNTNERVARQQAVDLANRQQDLASNYKNQYADAAPKASEPASPTAETAVAAIASEKRLDQAGAPLNDKLTLSEKEGFARKSEDSLSKGDVELQVAPGEPIVVQTEFAASWVIGADGEEPELLFSRQVVLEGTAITQGFWLDWPALRKSLLSSAADLLPSAALRPVLRSTPLDDPALLGRTLAAIPAELVVQRPSLAQLPAWSPVRTTLAVTWLIALAAITSAAIVLRASHELAERRGRFVSAVTHELRTPLTTFCLYSQMLADGMVKDGDGQRSYLNTLKSESQRLAGIVESVLDYARLGRGRPSPRVRVDVPELLAQIVPALQARCEQGGMQLVVESSQLDGVALRTDPATIGRVLYNLIDNACKYASTASDNRVHLSARAVGKDLLLSVQDHGAGVHRVEHSRIFRAFYRGHQQSDGSIPGLGLGLALSRGLARQLGGDLRLAPTAEGAEFRLRIPLESVPS